MTKTIFIAFCLLCGPAFAGGTPEWQSYAAALRATCPIKHLEYLSAKDLNSLIERHRNGIASEVQRMEVDRSEGRDAEGHIRECAKTSDLTCRNSAYLRAMGELQWMTDFAAEVCSEHILCRGPADCRSLSSAETLDLMEMSLKAEGPKATLKHYFDCFGGDGYERVASGDPRALKVGYAVFQVSDACYSEALESAFGSAMQVNPEAVLPYVFRFKPLLNICVPFLSDEEPKADVLESLARSEKALKSVTRKDLVKARDHCLKEVHDYQETVRQKP